MKAALFALRVILPIALAVPLPASAKSCAIAVPSGSGANPAALVGTYDGGQMEVGAFLALAADGKFQYELAYGALDESAEGRWSYNGSAVVLTTDPIVAPRFVFLGEKPGKPGSLRISLDLPDGLDRQYFDARVTSSDGRTITQQLGEDGLDLDIEPGMKLASVMLALPIYDLVSEPAKLSGVDGAVAAFRFEPNDIGKVAFDGTVLPIEGCALALDRFDRHLRFRKAPQD